VHRPADVCPFRRPFGLGFCECIAYRPLLHLPVDTQHKPLHQQWTCAHLEVGLHDGAAGHFYAACKLGTPSDRRRWAEACVER
jgi:hypothetical protein